MQILTIWKGFEALKCKLKLLKGIRNIQMQILTIRKGFEAFEAFEHKF